MKKHLIFSLTLLFIGFMSMQGQFISISATSSGGGYTTSATGSMSCTVGQLVFRTAEDPTGILTQGFQQPGCIPAGTACDDGDPCTVGDVEDGLCNCAGVPATNTAPVGDAGGPYAIEVGNDLILDGSATYDPDTACGDLIVSYSWDVNGDLVYGDATGVNPTLTWASGLAALGITGPGVYNVSIQVTDNNGGSDVGMTTLIVTSATVPTLGQWGLIILGLSFLCAGSIVIWRREYPMALETI